MLAFMVRHKIKPPVDVVFDLDRIQDAYRTVEAGNFFGKVAVNGQASDSRVLKSGDLVDLCGRQFKFEA